MTDYYFDSMRKRVVSILRIADDSSWTRVKLYEVQEINSGFVYECDGYDLSNLSNNITPWHEPTPLTEMEVIAYVSFQEG